MGNGPCFSQHIECAEEARSTPPVPWLVTHYTLAMNKGDSKDLDISEAGLGPATDVQLVAVPTHVDGEKVMGAAVAPKQTNRHLLPRHIQLMAFSGAIGTGRPILCATRTVGLHS